MYHAITSLAFITNVNPMTYIPFRKEQTIINIWHGYPLKTVGKYESTFNPKQINTSTCFISHSKQYTDFFLKDAFEFKGDVLNLILEIKKFYYMHQHLEVILKKQKMI